MSHIFKVGDHVEYKGYNDPIFTGMAFGVVVKTTGESIHIRVTEHNSIPDMIGKISSKFPCNVQLNKSPVSEHTIRELMP